MSILHIRDSRTNENPQEIPNGLQNQTGGRRNTESVIQTGRSRGRGYYTGPLQTTREVE
jgi:hypothetical protein